MTFSMQRNRIDKVPRELILLALAEFAAKNGYVAFGFRDFDARENENGTIHSSTVKREFNGWSNATDALKAYLAERNISLIPRSTTYFSPVTLAEEMRRIWLSIGHRPSRVEWEASAPKISYSTYKRYFGGWEAACLAFVEGTMGKGSLGSRQNNKVGVSSIIKQNPRDVPPKMRLKVFFRDHYRCVFCGRGSPDHILHADHKVPWSKGGKTVLHNLQTLCATCNAAKGNSEEFERV